MNLRRALAILLFIASFLLMLSPVAVAQTLDQYGGYVGLSVPGGATGFFRVAKLGSRWVFSTPEGNAFWMLGVFAVDVDDRFVDLATKYGGTNPRATWGVQATRRMKAWGFNTPAEYSSAYVLPGQPGVEKLPFMVLVRPSSYGLTNRWNYAVGPFKGLSDCLGQTYSGYRTDGPPDIYDPNFDAYVGGFTADILNDPFWGGLATSPWAIGITVDDADNLFGFGPGPEVPTPRLHPHIGWLALAVAPTKAASTTLGITYADPKVYTKYALQAFLQAKYGTIAALNAVWGATYTTWDSAGGYGVGTGFLDEDGRHTAWLGSTDGMLVGAAPAVVADLDAFLYQYAKQYFATVTKWVRQYAPHQLVFGPASLNGWGGLTRQPILQAAGQYVDVLNAMVSSQTVLDKTAQYFGDKPIVTWEGYVANPDSALYAYPNPPASDSLAYPFSFNTQADRAQNYAARLNFLLNATTARGVAPMTGLKFWAWADSWGEQRNWGLVSLKDNAYDGKEAIIAPGTDPWGDPIGGEDQNYGDFLAIHQANQGVYAVLTGTTPPPMNQAPAVGAGLAQTITLPASASLNGTATDDGLPNPPGVVTATWTMINGPGSVTFGNASALSTTATFSVAGSYFLRLTATDGALSASSDVTITVLPEPTTTPPVTPTRDTTPPTVSITTPTNGISVSRSSTVIITANASDNVGVTKVQFYVNGTLKCSVTTGPYTCGWGVPRKSGKIYRLQAKAYDAQGNVASSGIVRVTAR